MLASRSRILVPLAVLLAAACGGPETFDSPDLAGQLSQGVVQPRGDAATLDVASWNIVWFGSTGNGPSNEALQLANARDVISGTDFDVWGLAEIVGNTAFNDLESQLTGYSGFVSNEAVVAGGSSWYTASEQKLALLYKSSLATLVSAKVILTGNDYDFAGRPPLEATLRVTLNGVTEDRVFIVLHMKAFNDEASWQRRQNAGIALKSYLDSTYPTQKVFIVGDFNDDLDTSITPGLPTPYANFVNDPADYTFPTQELTNAGISSSCNYPDTVDHHLNTNEQYGDYVPASAASYRDLANQVSGYCTNTSDHFPILSRYAFGTGGPPPPPPPPGGDFSLSVSPSSQTIVRGSSASYAVAINRIDSFADLVTLSVSGLPAGATATFSSNPVAGTSSTLTVATTTSTPKGTYPLTITGVSGSLSRTASASLTVNRR